MPTAIKNAVIGIVVGFVVATGVATALWRTKRGRRGAGRGSALGSSSAGGGAKYTRFHDALAARGGLGKKGGFKGGGSSTSASLELSGSLKSSVGSAGQLGSGSLGSGTLSSSSKPPGPLPPMSSPSPLMLPTWDSLASQLAVGEQAMEWDGGVRPDHRLAPPTPFSTAPPADLAAPEPMDSDDALPHCPPPIRMDSVQPMEFDTPRVPFCPFPRAEPDRPPSSPFAALAFDRSDSDAGPLLKPLDRAGTALADSEPSGSTRGGSAGGNSSAGSQPAPLPLQTSSGYTPYSNVASDDTLVASGRGQQGSDGSESGGRGGFGEGSSAESGAQIPLPLSLHGAPSIGLQELLGDDWMIQAQDIEICRRADGAEWVLGQGAFGKVGSLLRAGRGWLGCNRQRNGHICPVQHAGMYRNSRMIVFVCQCGQG